MQIIRNRSHRFLLYIIAVFLLCNLPAMATQFEFDETVLISNIHIIDGDLYTWGDKVIVNGEIQGDLIGGGGNISIKGFIQNSASIFANNFSHTGDINGSLRIFASDVLIEGTIGRSALFFCNDVKIGKNAVIEKDVYFNGGKIELEGTVHGDVSIKSGMSASFASGIYAAKNGIYISGTIDGDLTIKGNNIHIIAPALIKGNFTYVSENQAEIDIKSGVTILGNTTWDLPENTEVEESESFFVSSVKHGSSLLAALLLGLLLMVLCRKYINAMVFQLQERFAISAAVGFISLAVLVIFLLILILTLVLVAVGLTLLAKGEAVSGSILLALSTVMIPISSISTVALSAMFYSGKIIVALLLGYIIVGKLKSNPAYLSKSQLLLGLILLYILFALPYIGFLLFVIISIIGIGAMILGIKSCNKGLNKNDIEDQAGI